MSEYENYCEKNLCLYSKTVPLFTHDEDKRPHKKTYFEGIFNQNGKWLTYFNCLKKRQFTVLN